MLICVFRIELCLQKRRIEAEWPRFRFERHAAAAVDQADAVGPSGVRAFGRVAHVVDQRGNLDAQLRDAAGRDARSFVETPRQPENNALPDVAGHLPHVAGMRRWAASARTPTGARNGVSESSRRPYAAFTPAGRYTGSSQSRYGAKRPYAASK
jgi:hypothetical protein